MQEYIGVKVVQAGWMTRGDYNKYRGWTMPPDENPDDSGYLVVYPDGYESWCPKRQFEEANRPTDGMPFGYAIEALRKGDRVARRGWNGKGMWLVLIAAGNAIHATTAGSFDMQDCIGMKTADGNMQPGWLASQADMLADDWMIVE